VSENATGQVMKISKPPTPLKIPGYATGMQQTRI
jgi:hypothetical protein